jgi:hypothetical protein
MKNLLLKALPHVAAVLLFVVISCVFLHPIFDGYVLNQGDIKTYLGMSKEIRDYREATGEDPLWTNSMFGGMPAYQISAQHPGNWMKVMDKVVKLGLPRQVDVLFLAMLGFYILLMCLRIRPLVAIPVSVVYGLGSIFLLYLEAGHTSKVYAIAYMAPTLGGVLLAFRGKAMLGAGLAALFGSLHLAANHLQMTYYLMFLLGAVVLAELVRNMIERRFADTGKALGFLAFGGILAVLPNLGNILTTYEYSAYSTRGGTELTLECKEGKTPTTAGLEVDYMLEYSMARGEFWSFMIPDIKGGKSGYIGDDKSVLSDVKGQEMKQVLAQQMRYWGAQAYTGGAFYIGALICLFFLLWFFAPGDLGLKIALGLLTVLVVMLSWREPNGIGWFFIEKFPLYNKFRDTKMILVLLMLMLPLGAALFLEALAAGRMETTRSRKILLGGAAGVVLLLLLFIATPSTFFDFSFEAERASFDRYLEQSTEDQEMTSFIYQVMDELPAVRQKILKADASRSLFLVVIGLAGALLLMFRKVKPYVVLPVLGLVMLIDIWSVDRRYLTTENPRRNNSWIAKSDMERPYKPSKADVLILENEINRQPELADLIEKEISARSGKLTDSDRAAIGLSVLNRNSNYRVLTFANPISEASVPYFHKSIGGYHGAKMRRFQELVDCHLLNEMNRIGTDAQMLGLQAALRRMSVLNMLNTRYIIPNPEAEPVENPMALGNAWFVDEIMWTTDADDEMETLADADLRTMAVMDERWADSVKAPAPADSTATIELTEYRPNRLTYRSNNAADGLAVFSEIFYDKGWQAYINGQPVPHFRTNYLLRALNVPAGEHEIVFAFEPASHRTGNRIAHIGSLLLLLLLAGGFYFDGKRND